MTLILKKAAAGFAATMIVAVSWAAVFAVPVVSLQPTLPIVG